MIQIGNHSYDLNYYILLIGTAINEQVTHTNRRPFIKGGVQIHGLQSHMEMYSSPQ